jgi:hypothetical protein
VRELFEISYSEKFRDSDLFEVSSIIEELFNKHTNPAVFSEDFRYYFEDDFYYSWNFDDNKIKFFVMFLGRK